MSEIIDFNELKATGALPSPRGVMLAVIRLCQREQVSLQELARTVQTDPVLAGRIIKLANAANPVKTRSIAAVTTDVLILIGVHAVRQVALGLSLAASYRNGACEGFDYGRFWTRSLAMACAARAIGERIRVAPAAELFTCGLLAGIGRLGIASARPLAYSRLLEEMRGCWPEELTLAEARLFGYSHLSLAAAMMADWNIPRMFGDAVLFHEKPHASSFAIGSRQQRLTHGLHLAALIADLCVATDDERTLLVPSVFEAAAVSGLADDQVALLVDEVSREWAEWGEVLQLHTRALSLLPESGADLTQLSQGPIDVQ